MKAPGAATIIGFHHVRVPVSDVLTSRDWYMDILDLGPLLVVEEEDRIRGVALEHPSGVVIGLHQDRERARALRGFVLIGLSVPDVAAWVRRLDQRCVAHGPPGQGHLGRYVRVADPDGILIELHTPAQPSAGEA